MMEQHSNYQPIISKDIGIRVDNLPVSEISSVYRSSKDERHFLMVLNFPNLILVDTYQVRFRELILPKVQPEMYGLVALSSRTLLVLSPFELAFYDIPKGKWTLLMDSVPQVRANGPTYSRGLIKLFECRLSNNTPYRFNQHIMHYDTKRDILYFVDSPKTVLIISVQRRKILVRIPMDPKALSKSRPNSSFCIKDSSSGAT